jgi:hypothetical protein
LSEPMFMVMGGAIGLVLVAARIMLGPDNPPTM